MTSYTGSAGSTCRAGRRPGRHRSAGLAAGRPADPDRCRGRGGGPAISIEQCPPGRPAAEPGRHELRVVLDGDVPVLSYLTQVEAHLLDAFACRDLGDERASREAAEQALNLAEPDRLILPFAMTGAWQLLETMRRHGTSHAALVTTSSTPSAVLDGAG